MNQLAELIAVAVRPVMMVVIAAPAYKLGKLFISRRTAAGVSLLLTTLLFLFDLFSIQVPDLRLATAVSTLVGFALLTCIFWKRVARQD
ncbi:hypothetical protein [Novosphingobium sp. ZW T3_23]|uniref:hypothetical protein n=1 Tax=Novosphingobium sp. ZW T3_23 TaxID=3378084 RepID=UPI0038547C7D